MTGAETHPFEVSIIEQAEVRGSFREGCTDLLYRPDLLGNLLGRDLELQLGIGVIPREGCMVVKMMVLRQEDEEGIIPELWAEKGGHGLLSIPPIEIKMRPDILPIRVEQYPMSAEGKQGLAPVIEELIQDGILKPCMSPHNTPVLPVKKLDGI